MKELLEAIVKALVDNPDQIHVLMIEGEGVTVLNCAFTQATGVR